jgi:hypothetical protein
VPDRLEELLRIEFPEAGGGAREERRRLPALRDRRDRDHGLIAGSRRIK